MIQVLYCTLTTVGHHSRYIVTFNHSCTGGRGYCVYPAQPAASAIHTLMTQHWRDIQLSLLTKDVGHVGCSRLRWGPPLCTALLPQSHSPCSHALPCSRRGQTVAEGVSVFIKADITTCSCVTISLISLYIKRRLSPSSVGPVSNSKQRWQLEPWTVLGCF